MPEVGIALYGYPPRFDRHAGPLVALIEVAGGTDCYLIDRERNRCRIESFPGEDLDRWTTPDGVLLAARRNWWGLAIRLDRVPFPFLFPVACPSSRTPLMLHRSYKRAWLPGDLASCPTCQQLLVIERDRQGDGFRLVTPSRRLAASARSVMIAAGLLPFAVGYCKGRGRLASRPHGQDCYDLPLFRPFAEPAVKRRRRRSMGARESRTRAAKGGGR